MKPTESSYRPFTWRRRLLILLLALATAWTIILTLVGEPGGARLGREERAAGPPLCSHGQSSGCVGGKVEVIAPAAAASAAPR